jgi:hypothetical protein
VNKLTTEILMLGYEDVTGLWEIPWADAEHAGQEETPPRSDDIELFVGLVRDGYIEVVVGPDWAEFDDGERATPDQVSDTLRDPRVWRSPETGEHTVRFETTDAGFAEYRKAIGWFEQ